MSSTLFIGFSKEKKKKKVTEVADTITGRRQKASKNVLGGGEIDDCEIVDGYE